MAELRRPITILALVAVVVGGGIGLAPISAGAATNAAGPDPGTDGAAIAEARTLWESPVERLAFISYGVVERRDGGRVPCPDPQGRNIETVVGAYTLFGVLASRVLVDCSGSTERL